VSDKPFSQAMKEMIDKGIVAGDVIRDGDREIRIDFDPDKTNWEALKEAHPRLYRALSEMMTAEASGSTEGLIDASDPENVTAFSKEEAIEKSYQLAVELAFLIEQNEDDPTAATIAKLLRHWVKVRGATDPE
jgi:hypothetical protein